MTPNPPLRHRNKRGSVSGPLLPPRTLQLLESFRDELRARYAERTVPEYMRSVLTFVAWLSERGVGLAQARSDDVLAYQKELSAMVQKSGKLYSVSSQASRLNAIKQLFRCLYKRGMLLSDPAASMSLPRLPKALPRVILTQRETLRLLAHVKGHSPFVLRDKAMLETLYATGVRVSELSGLSVSDVDTEERLLRVFKGKGGKDRNLPLTSAAAEAIEAYLARGRAKLLCHPRRELFIGDRGAKLSRSAVNHIIRAWAKAARIRKHITCHTFRHSVATHLLQNRADIRHIQALLGHASLATTEIYTRVAVRDLKEVVARAHPRGR